MEEQKDATSGRHAESASALSKLLDYLSSEHAWQDQEKEWEASGDLPDDFERTYRSEGSYQEDETRLQAMGYRPIRHQDMHAIYGWFSRPFLVANYLRVTYQRNRDPLLAPGTSYNDEPPNSG